MPDRFYSADIGNSVPSQITEGGATSGKSIELRVNSTAYANKMSVLLAVEALKGYLITRETTPIA